MATVLPRDASRLPSMGASTLSGIGGQDGVGTARPHPPACPYVRPLCVWAWSGSPHPLGPLTVSSSPSDSILPSSVQMAPCGPLQSFGDGQLDGHVAVGIRTDGYLPANVAAADQPPGPGHRRLPVTVNAWSFSVVVAEARLGILAEGAFSKVNLSLPLWLWGALRTEAVRDGRAAAVAVAALVTDSSLPASSVEGDPHLDGLALVVRRSRCRWSRWPRRCPCRRRPTGSCTKHWSARPHRRCPRCPPSGFPPPSPYR